jgi:hypothetical protein
VFPRAPTWLPGRSAEERSGPLLALRQPQPGIAPSREFERYLQFTGTADIILIVCIIRPMPIAGLTAPAALGAVPAGQVVGGDSPELAAWRG